MTDLSFFIYKPSVCVLYSPYPFLPLLSVESLKPRSQVYSSHDAVRETTTLSSELLYPLDMALFA